MLSDWGMASIMIEMTFDVRRSKFYGSNLNFDLKLYELKLILIA